MVVSALVRFPQSPLNELKAVTRIAARSRAVSLRTTFVIRWRIFNAETGYNAK